MKVVFEMPFTFSESVHEAVDLQMIRGLLITKSCVCVCVCQFLNRGLCWSLKEFRQISICLSESEFGAMFPCECRLPTDASDFISLRSLFRGPGMSL